MSVSTILISSPRVTKLADYPLYEDALDFLNRAKAEGKDNDVNMELFHLIYGDELAAKFIAEGFFNSQNN